ncbi:SRPBCC family protein [Leifsonia sp. NPDC080035]|uniref:SRPBCC family protein n=1 Tax=Leifsonia sp. NPDC080035 TaxID=3143936 RepID=A0AAU7GFM0_9MICO
MAASVIVERTERILVAPDRLLPMIANLPQWIEWSPWEGTDPGMDREYGGEPGTVGSSYRWEGDRKAGAGSMRITAVDPDGVSIDLRFTRPFRSTSDIRFVLDAEGDDATRVIWRMESPKTFLSRFINLDKLVGPDFERGLRQLKQVAES